MKEELDRKSMESVAWLYESVSAGRITPAQFSTGLDSLFIAVSGLACNDVFELITAGSDLAATADTTWRRFFNKGTAMIQFSWKPGDTHYTMRAWVAGAEKQKRVRDFDTPAQAYEEFKKAATTTVATGFIEI